MFIGVLYFVVGEDIILPQRTITACFREADSLPYGVCANSKQTDKSKFEGQIDVYRFNGSIVGANSVRPFVGFSPLVAGDQWSPLRVCTTPFRHIKTHRQIKI